MKILEEDLSEVGLYKYPKRSHLFGDWENIEFNQKTNELFYHSSSMSALLIELKLVNSVCQSLLFVITIFCLEYIEL